MRHTLFDAPRGETIDVRASLQRKRHILMPGDEPIGLGRFVKINGADRNWIVRKMRTNAEIEQLVRLGEGGNRRQ